MVFGMFASLPDRDVLNGEEKDLSFSSDVNMFKIKEEHFAQSGQTVVGTHGLNYFPFFIPINYDTSITNGHKIGIGTADNYVSRREYSTQGYIFIAFNPGFI